MGQKWDSHPWTPCQEQAISCLPQTGTKAGIYTWRCSNTQVLFVLRHGEANRSGDDCEEMLVCYTPRSQEEGARHAMQGRTAPGSARMGQGAERARAKHGQEPSWWFLWERQGKAG